MTGSKASPDPTLDGTLAEARRLLERGELDGATRGFAEMRERRPERPEGPLGLATIAARQEEWQAAFVLATEAIEREATCLDAYLLLAEIAWFGGMPDMAIGWLEAGIQPMQGEPLLFEWLVRLYAMDGRLEELKHCLGHYAGLRRMKVHDAALVFARDANLPTDVRSRIVAASRS